jgi:predicted small integral membrane protein
MRVQKYTMLFSGMLYWQQANIGLMPAKGILQMNCGYTGRTLLAYLKHTVSIWLVWSYYEVTME